MSLADDIRNAWQSGGDPEPSGPVSLWKAPQEVIDTLDRMGGDKALMLTPGEQNQLAELKKYARMFAARDSFDDMKEGSLNKLMEKCTPRVQAVMKVSRLLAENIEETGGRKYLFDERKEMPKLDPLDQKIIERTRHEEAVEALHDRLGTAQQQQELNSAPATLRETIDMSMGDNNE